MPPSPRSSCAVQMHRAFLPTTYSTPVVVWLYSVLPSAHIWLGSVACATASQCRYCFPNVSAKYEVQPTYAHITQTPQQRSVTPVYPPFPRHNAHGTVRRHCRHRVVLQPSFVQQMLGCGPLPAYTNYAPPLTSVSPPSSDMLANLPKLLRELGEKTQTDASRSSMPERPASDVYPGSDQPPVTGAHVTKEVQSKPVSTEHEKSLPPREPGGVPKRSRVRKATESSPPRFIACRSAERLHPTWIRRTVRINEPFLSL